MVDLEPFLDAPFESASNVSFELLLFSGAVLLGVVALVGRTTATTALVVCYLLAVPGYVAFRVHVWEGPDEQEDASDEDDEGEATDEEWSDEASSTD